MNLLLLKIGISIVVVIGLAEISKRINPIIGGILNGLPLGTGLSVYFIALENGTDYILPGIPWGIAALAGSLLFCLVYYHISLRLRTVSRLWGILLSSVGGLCAFGVFGGILKYFQLDFFSASVLFLCCYIGNLCMMNTLKIEASKSARKSSMLQIIFRGVFVSILIVALTTLGRLLGSEWAGIVSSFPSTLFALLIVLHYEEGHQMFVSVIYGFSFSIFVLFVFYIACRSILPILNLNSAFVAIYGISGFFLLFFNIVIKSVRKRLYVA